MGVIFMGSISTLRRAFAAFAVASCLHLSAHAQLIPGYSDDVKAYDPREVALLPNFCKHTQEFRERVPGGGDRQQIDNWQAVLGPMYHHLHHYCWGMMKATRGMVMARTQIARYHYLNDAVREYDYVIERSPQDFVLLPEVLSRKGQALVRLGKGPAAIVSFERAIDLKPDYWPPYAYASDYYKELGEVQLAKEVLERGLTSAPDTGALQRRLTELSGGSSGNAVNRKTGKQ
jgi:tetratricopeptide (TPR) repeat protein